MSRTSLRERNKSKKQPGKKPSLLRGWKPRLEVLEDRTVPAYVFSYNPVTHVASAIGDGATDSLTIEASGSQLGHSVNGGLFNFLWGGFTVPASFSETVNITLSGGDGSSLVLGDAANPASFLNAGFVLSTPANTTDTVTIDDSVSSSNSIYNVNTGIAPYSVTGLGINFTEPTGIAVGGITLMGGIGSNTVNVTSTFPNEPVSIVTATGVNTVNVGNAGTLNTILAALSVRSTGSQTTLNVNDTADTTHGTATLDNLSGNVNAPFEVTGLSAAPIEYGSGVVAVNVNGGTNGAAGVTYNVNNTQSGTTLTINGGANGDVVNLGNAAAGGGLDNLPGAVVVNGNGGTDTVNLNDQGGNFNDTYTVTNTSVSRPVFGGLTFYIGIENLTLNAENTLGVNGDNTINVNSTAAGVTTTINGNDGNDTFNITGSGLGVPSTNNFNGGNGNDTFNISPVPLGAVVNIDGGPPATFPGDTLRYNGAGSINITAPGMGTVSQTGFQTINFTGIELATTNVFSVISTPNGLVITGTGDRDYPNEDDTFVIFTDATGTFLELSLNGLTGLAVPLSAVFQINIFSLGGNDNLIVDSSHTLINIAGGIRYDSGTGLLDRLTLLQTGGTTQTSDTYSVGPNPGQGISTIVGPSGTQTVFFEHVKPVFDNVPATTVTINATPANNAINYSQGPGGGIFVGNTGLVTIDEQESYEFNNKTNLVINALAGSDTINLHYNNIVNPAGLTGTITVNGADPTASDTLIVNGINGVLDNLRYLPTSVGAGTVINDNEPQPNVLFTGIEHLTEVVQQADGDGVRIEGTIGNDAIEFFEGVTSDSGSFVGTMDQNNATGVGPFTMTPMNFTGASPIANDSDVNFFNPGGTDSIVFNGTGNDDNIVIQTGEAGGTEFRNTLNNILMARLEVFNVASGLVRGLAGNDNVTVNSPAGPAAVTLRVEGGDSDQFTDTLTYNASANSATGVNLPLATITQTAPAGNTVTYNGVERINLRSSGAGSTLTITGSTGDETYNFVTTGAGAGSFTASALGNVAYTSPFFTYAGPFGGAITINDLAGVDTLNLAGTSGNDNINAVQSSATALAYTLNAFTQNFTLIAMETVGIDAAAGNDVVRVSVADALQATPASSWNFLVNGGLGNDRLLVNDDGIGDLTVLRQIDGQSGNATVGALNPITYSSTERIDVTPVNNLTGGTGTDGNGRVVAFHADPFEYNDTRLTAGQLTRAPEFPTSPNIDSAAITNPFAVGGDEDWYQFLPTQTGIFDISIIYRRIGTLANGRSGLPGAGDLTLDIFDATGALITSGVATVDQSGMTHLSAVFGATNDPASVFHVIFVRVRGASPDSVNVYDFEHLGTNATLQTDNNGPQVTNVFITDFPGYNLFGLKPVDALQGPTPLINSITISFQDPRPLPVPPGFTYPALDPITAGTPGQYVLRGDRVGVVAIQQIIVTNDPVVVGQTTLPTATVTLVFAHPLLDDHYTLTVSDHIRDPAGNKLDGESNAQEPNEGPTFPSGDGHPGGNFIAAFVVDSVPELGFYANGSANIDINGDFIVNPNVLPGGDVILPYGPNGAAVFSGQFSDLGAVAVNGFDRLGTYGREGGVYGFRLDFNDDGDFNDPGEFIPSVLQINGMPIAGHFSDVKAGDEVGLFTGTRWYLDTNGNNMIDGGDTILTGNMRGLPITGDFDGDGFVDLGTYQNGTFYFDLAANGLSGNTDTFFRVQGLPGGVNGVASRLARPVAGDFNRDGITDVGLFIPNQTNLTRYQANWYFLVSNENLFGPRISGTVNNLNHPFRSNQLPGGSNDFSTAYGSSRALPIVGNFDPPRAVIAARSHGATTSATHLANLLLAHDLTDLYFATDIDPRTGMLRRHHN